MVLNDEIRAPSSCEIVGMINLKLYSSCCWVVLMIFDYLSEIRELVYDCFWNMFEFTSLMIVDVCMLMKFELVWLFW